MLYILLMVLPEESQCDGVRPIKLLEINRIGELRTAFLIGAVKVLLK